MVLPALAAALLFAWACWCYGASPPVATAPAVAVGGAVLVGACAAYSVLVGGSGGLFGALFLALGLLLTVTAADQAASRGSTATCVVGEVHTKVEHSAGEGSPGPKKVYRLVLRCPGGYPAELKEDRPVAAAGEEVRVAYDPRRRVAPAVEGGASPWAAAVCAVLLLALCTVIASAKRDRSGK
ncbi:hypothetical protein [Streptomyces sp. NPDC091268]|uniref:hypothetical protein n=1 Tax=Streptomyces sp. NPDC091268 TaxID=3365979 RepID=UPI00382A6879